MATSPSEPVPPEVIALAVAMALTDALPAAARPRERPSVDRWKWADFDEAEEAGAGR